MYLKAPMITDRADYAALLASSTFGRQYLSSQSPDFLALASAALSRDSASPKSLVRANASASNTSRSTRSGPLKRDPGEARSSRNARAGLGVRLRTRAHQYHLGRQRATVALLEYLSRLCKATVVESCLEFCLPGRLNISCPSHLNHGTPLRSRGHPAPPLRDYSNHDCN